MYSSSSSSSALPASAAGLPPYASYTQHTLDPVVDDPARSLEAFRHDDWLRAYPLTPNTVLDYFAFSQFYQRDSLNERLKAAGMDSLAASATASRDPSLRGVCYVLLPTGSEPELFAIERRVKGEGGSVAVLSTYYVIRGTVYQSPDLASLVLARVERAAAAVSRAAHHLAAAAVAPQGEAAGVAAALGGIGGAAAAAAAAAAASASAEVPRTAGEASLRGALEEALRGAGGGGGGSG
jgi:hypothetical protein